MDIFPDLPLSDSRYLFLNAISCYLNQSDSLDQFNYLLFAGPVMAWGDDHNVKQGRRVFVRLLVLIWA